MSNPLPSTPTGAAANAAPGAGTPQQLNQIVIEYLSKKGYSKTEAMLRVESAHTDADGRPIVSRPEDSPDTMYERAYTHLRRYIDNGLDLYQNEFRRLLFPVFVHFYLNMIASGHMNPGKSFWNNHHQELEAKYGHDLKELSTLSLPNHVEENSLAKLYREKKYRVNMTKITGDLLLAFLDETGDLGGRLVLDVISRYLEIKQVSGRPAINAAQDDILDDEGIQGHSTAVERTSSGTLPRVKLGAFPMDKELMREVEDELRDEDAKMQDSGDFGSTTGTLVDGFQKIKREESDESPGREMVPLPPYTITDVDREVKLVKEHREMYKLQGGPSPALPGGVIMHTFHNTNDGLQCLDFSQDTELVAGGFAESYVRIWSLKGTPLESIVPSENLPTIPKSRRLIGHSGPVFGVSFSPDSKYLLSCSEDKSARLWSLDTFTGLVVYKGHDAPVWDVAFGPFGHYFATASHDHTARLWSCDHIYPLRIFAGHHSDVDAVVFHPNSAYIFTGSSDKTARMWDIQSGNQVRLFTGHTGPITALAVSPDGKHLATAAEDSLISLWDIASGKRQKIMRGHGKTSIYTLAFSQEGTVLISGGADMTVRCWDVHQGSDRASDRPEPINGTGPTGTAAGDSSTKVDGAAPGGGKRKGKDIVATPDQLAVFYTKKTPVYKLQFTHRNIAFAGGAFLS